MLLHIFHYKYSYLYTYGVNPDVVTSRASSQSHERYSGLHCLQIRCILSNTLSQHKRISTAVIPKQGEKSRFGIGNLRMCICDAHSPGRS